MVVSGTGGSGECDLEEGGGGGEHDLDGGGGGSGGFRDGVVKVDDPLPSGRQPQTTTWYTLVPGGQALCSRSSKRDSSRP
jgi:hypothetical protein